MLLLGYSETDITPENGEDLCGFALRSPGSVGIFDRLKVRWVSLKATDGTTVLLGSADIIGLSCGAFDEIKQQILARISTGAAPPYIALATTHTHSGPVTVTLHNCGRLDASYVERLQAAIVKGAIEAFEQDQIKSQVLLGKSFSSEAENRRQGESGPVDHEVLALSFVDPDSRKHLATIVNYTCHPVVLGHVNNHVSADFPGYLTSYVENETGAPCLFINGAAGDQNPRSGDHGTDKELARQVGESVGRAALEAVKNYKVVPADSLHWFTQKVQLPVYQFSSPAELENRLEMIRSTFGIDTSVFAERVERDNQQLQNSTYPRTIEIELSLLAIGPDLGILFVPGELFCSIGLKFKKMFGDRTIVISGFSNGSVGYLPDKQAYADGGYEPYFANFFYDFPQFDPSIEEVLLDAAGQLAAKAAQL